MHAGLYVPWSALPPPGLEAWRASFSWWDAWLLNAVLVAIFPAWAWWGYHRLRASGRRLTGGDRLRVYASVMASEWLLVAATLLVARRHGVPGERLGLGLGSPGATLAAAAGLLAACLLLSLAQLAQIRRTPPERLAAGVERIRDFLPRGGREIAGWIALALTAGICEEILYRGWLVSVLSAALGSVGAGVVAGAVLFGIGHAYQGRKGMLGAGALGLVFGAAFAMTGSLLPGQVLHAVFDVVNGLLGAAIVSRLPGPGTTGEGTIPGHG